MAFEGWLLHPPACLLFQPPLRFGLSFKLDIGFRVAVLAALRHMREERKFLHLIVKGWQFLKRAEPEVKIGVFDDLVASREGSPGPRLGIAQAEVIDVIGQSLRQTEPCKGSSAHQGQEGRQDVGRFGNGGVKTQIKFRRSITLARKGGIGGDLNKDISDEAFRRQQLRARTGIEVLDLPSFLDPVALNVIELLDQAQ
ncbi:MULTISPECIES: hypothetical protein [unclassified Mesorhizobium]|uniref:hypothetical protein n=1 Tax=unclassified Mesorhizobium TaxID=325217 RepID=UPI00333E0B8F